MTVFESSTRRRSPPAGAVEALTTSGPSHDRCQPGTTSHRGEVANATVPAGSPRLADPVAAVQARPRGAGTGDDHRLAGQHAVDHLATVVAQISDGHLSRLMHASPTTPGHALRLTALTGGCGYSMLASSPFKSALQTRQPLRDNRKNTLTYGVKSIAFLS